MSYHHIDSRVVKTRKKHQCLGCLDIIPPGSSVQRNTGTWEGEIGSSYVCGPCEEYLGLYWDEHEYSEGQLGDARNEAAMGEIGHPVCDYFDDFSLIEREKIAKIFKEMRKDNFVFIEDKARIEKIACALDQHTIRVFHEIDEKAIKQSLYGESFALTHSLGLMLSKLGHNITVKTGNDRGKFSIILEEHRHKSLKDELNNDNFIYKLEQKVRQLEGQLENAKHHNQKSTEYLESRLKQAESIVNLLKNFGIALGVLAIAAISIAPWRLF